MIIPPLMRVIMSLYAVLWQYEKILFQKQQNEDYRDEGIYGLGNRLFFSILLTVLCLIDFVLRLDWCLKDLLIDIFPSCKSILNGNEYSLSFFVLLLFWLTSPEYKSSKKYIYLSAMLKIMGGVVMICYLYLEDTGRFQ